LTVAAPHGTAGDALIFEATDCDPTLLTDVIVVAQRVLGAHFQRLILNSL